MRIGRDPAARMLDQKEIAVAAQFVAGIGDDPGIDGLNRRAARCRNIDPVIVGAVRPGAIAFDDMADNERSTAVNPAEAVEEQVSLSDRFGLWLGFHNIDQSTYHAIVRGYVERYQLELPARQIETEANEWAITRGSRSGRVAWQYVQDLAGRLGKKLE